MNLTSRPAENRRFELRAIPRLSLHLQLSFQLCHYNVKLPLNCVNCQRRIPRHNAARKLQKTPAVLSSLAISCDFCRVVTNPSVTCITNFVKLCTHFVLHLKPDALKQTVSPTLFLHALQSRRGGFLKRHEEASQVSTF